MNASGTSFSAAEHWGSLSWSADPNAGVWMPRIPGGLPYYNGTINHPFQNPKYRYPASFSNAALSVTCSPVCGLGHSFSIDLTMSNFSLIGQRPYAYPGLNIFVGTLNLITRPIVLTSSSGIAIARFTETGDLLACTDATCGTTLFSLSVQTEGYATIRYSLSGGQLSISSVSYVLPEPSSLVLLGTGLVFILGRLRSTMNRSV